MTIDGVEDLEGMRRAGRLVAEVRDAMLAAVAPGVTTGELDAIARDAFRRHGARSAPRLAYGFPGNTCISVNDEAAHGIPSPQRRLADGDLVNIDVSAELDGYWADPGARRGGATIAPRHQELLDATRLAQREAMAEARAGAPLRRIGRAVERRARREGFTVIADLCGHGVGRSIHEEPSVPGVEDRRDGTLLWEGLVIAIEPFLATGARSVRHGDDGWTLLTDDGGVAAQFEHTVVVTANGPLVLTEAA
jgi:methionyl aminopeptidase